MAAQTPTTLALIDPSDKGVGYGIYTAVVTSNDTVTLSDFTDLLNIYVINLATNAEATATKATNVVTVTQAALTTAKILIFAQGA